MIPGIEAVQAIHFGLRSWSVEQLGFLDAIGAADGVYSLYPKHVASRLRDRDLALAMLDFLKFDGEWATMRVADYVLSTGIQHHVSVDQVKSVLMSWLTDHSDLVAGIPTRESFITHGVPLQQQPIVLNGYLQGRDSAYVSHLRIHRTLPDRVKDGLRRS